MAKKQSVNKYGVKIGDFFVYQGGSDGSCVSHWFYQVTALRGETMVVLREVHKKEAAYENGIITVKPDPNNWLGSEDKAITRKVKISEYNNGVYVSLYSSMWGTASLMRDDEEYRDTFSG